MKYAVPPRELIAAPVLGGDSVFPIRRIFCVARNYAAHAREMGMDGRDPPFFFCKDADAYAPSGAAIPYPAQTADYHHEVELVVAIGRECFEIEADKAKGFIFGYAVGLDMTRRDVQAAARKAGQPWCFAKNFADSAPMSAITPIEKTGELRDAAISLSVNGQVRQSSNIQNMTWSVNEIIAHLSRVYRLQPGDLIFTGTPEGVGAVSPGDVLAARIAGLAELNVTIVAPQT